MTTHTSASKEPGTGLDTTQAIPVSTTAEIPTVGPPRPARDVVGVPVRKPVRRVPRWWRDATGAAFWAVIVGVISLWLANGGIQNLNGLTGWLLGIGRLSGLVGSALLLLQVMLIARVPWIEQAWGQDELVVIHRTVGFTSFWLVMVHVVTTWLGYAPSPRAGEMWTTLVNLVLDYPGMLLAAAGTIALVLVAVTSIRAARARLRYESWHLLHLYAYLGAGLALPHQLWTGADFLSSRPATVFWWGLYLLAVGGLVAHRIVVPLWRSLREPIRVIDVHQEGPDATTVTVSGTALNRLPVHGGQFFTWRFLDGPGWTRGNPYSLSHAPNGTTLTFTAVHAGDGSSRLADLPLGTRVLIEGPYGRLHEGVRTRKKVLLMGSGIGIAPMHALLQDLPAEPGDVTVIHRVHDEEHRYLGADLERSAADSGARYVVVAGPRIPGRDSWMSSSATELSDADGLLSILPNVAEHDVFLCGNEAWMRAARTALLAAGVPARNIHRERFAW